MFASYHFRSKPLSKNETPRFQDTKVAVIACYMSMRSDFVVVVGEMVEMQEEG